MGKNAYELGFIDAPPPLSGATLEHESAGQAPIPLPLENLPVSQQTQASDPPLAGLPIVLVRQQDLTQAVVAASDAQRRQPGEWALLAIESMIPLLEAGWSQEEVFQAIQHLLPVMQAMPKISRHTFMQHLFGFGAAAFVGTISDLSMEKDVSEEDRTKLCQALSESIISGWKLLVMARNVQALALSQAQLLLLEQVSSMLPVHERPRHFASVYNLMGMALCHQGLFHVALDAHSRAYIASLGAGDLLGVVFSLLGQASSYFALTQHCMAIETAQQALRTLDALDEPPLHIKAHLLGVWADSAMSIGDYKTARQNLDVIAASLDDLSPNEEFDRANWYQLSGKYAYFTGDYAAATHWCEQALQQLPSESIIRRVLALMPLLAANTAMRDLDSSLLTLEKARQMIPALQAPAMNQPLQQGLQGLLVVFPHETRIKTIVSELQQHLC